LLLSFRHFRKIQSKKKRAIGPLLIDAAYAASFKPYL
jgi:hypothetical protein